MPAETAPSLAAGEHRRCSHPHSGQSSRPRRSSSSSTSSSSTLARSGDSGPPWGDAHHPLLNHAMVHDAAVQIGPDQADHPPVQYPLPQAVDQDVVR